MKGKSLSQQISAIQKSIRKWGDPDGKKAKAIESLKRLLEAAKT